MTDENQNRILELEEQVQQLTHRLTGHQEAIARWRRRAGVEAPVEELELFKSEIYNFREDWKYREYYIMPIEKAPELAAEAWAWLLEHHLTDICERVAYDERKGWIVALVRDWRG